MGRILFVGQAPSRETEGKLPFTGKCGKFLALLLGTSQEEMLANHDFINVLDHWPGKGIGGDRFPLPEAKIAAKKKLGLLHNRLCVLLGYNVARAFGFNDFRYLESYEVRDPSDASSTIIPAIFIVPHPSGINRYYNDPEKKMAVSKFLMALANKTPNH